MYQSAVVNEYNGEAQSEMEMELPATSPRILTSRVEKR